MIAHSSLPTMKGFARSRRPRQLPRHRMLSRMKVCCPLRIIRRPAPAPLQADVPPFRSIPQMQQFLNLMPPSNGPDNGDGTGELITADKGATREDHGMVRIDHNFSNTHSLFARYTVDDSSSLVPYVGTPPGTYMPGFPTLHLARNQYGTDSGPYDIRHRNGSMSCASVSTEQRHLLRSTIRIRACRFLWFLIDRSE